MSRLSSDTSVLKNTVTSNVSMGLRWAATVIGGILFLFFISWKLTLVMITIVPIVAIGAKYYGTYVRNLSKQTRRALAKATEVAEESISAIRTVRSFAQEPKRELMCVPRPGALALPRVGVGTRVTVRCACWSHAATCVPPGLESGSTPRYGWASSQRWHRVCLLAARLAPSRFLSWLSSTTAARWCWLVSCPVASSPASCCTHSPSPGHSRDWRCVSDRVHVQAGPLVPDLMMFVAATQTPSPRRQGLFGDFMKSVGATDRVFQILDRTPTVPLRGGRTLDRVDGNVKFEVRRPRTQSRSRHRARIRSLWLHPPPVNAVAHRT